REITITKDGSHTLEVQDTQDTYHSRFGALQESQHVFIGAGLHPFIKEGQPVRVLEVGFGTGLNAFLTYLEAKEENVHIDYEGIEPAPISEQEYTKRNYPSAAKRHVYADRFIQLHEAPWNKPINMGALFTLTKHQTTVQDFKSPHQFHVIYFDAFAPASQPELWTTEIFDKMYALTKPGGVLVTYCSKGEVRRSLTAAGFLVEKLPGPAGKREMTRAIKTIEED
ncbi:MAG TPA: tRNA (5-methylaminomethyl-2-thiouridine)(34)-methyltransferase MnmD, partial [Phnomibacter sp.]|nr:tRNA (5-methylaminomethyl-2-thiouridine)(34)-methyltransferase MnmD [Phnomibacter sp.]